MWHIFTLIGASDLHLGLHFLFFDISEADAIIHIFQSQIVLLILLVKIGIKILPHLKCEWGFLPLWILVTTMSLTRITCFIWVTGVVKIIIKITICSS